jgi:dihydrofolate synthase / folylpolyglutamate synthase
MNYKEVLDYLNSQLPMFHRIGKAAYKANLDNTYALDEYFNHPHKKFKTIHVAGTNGKGSVSHFLASILQTAGYKTGLYTSPHLKDYRERIKINGIDIPENYVISFIEKHKPFFAKIQPSFFEMTVALAFDYFASEKVDIAVIEVGLGGRLDSTNIIKPLISVITNISLDHTDLLGDTLEKIAAEKAGIIKKDVPVVIGENHKKTRHVFIQKAEEVDSPIYLADYTYSANSSYFTSDHKQSFNILKNNKICFENLKTGLLGNYQQKNIVTVIQAIEVLRSKNIKIKDEDIFSGVLNVIPNTNFKGRWQIINDRPLTICDTGHNENGMEYIVRQISGTHYNRLHIIFGVVSDKNIDGILKQLPKDAIYYFTKANIPRALDEKSLSKQAENFRLKGETHATVADAFKNAKKNALPDDMIFIGGSTFVVAEIL